MDNTEDTQTQRYIIIAILAFLVGFGSAWLWLDKGEGIDKSVTDDSEEIMIDEMSDMTEDESADDSQSTSDKVNNASSTSVNSISVSDQVAGTYVNVSSVELSSMSWVVIREDNAGVPGKILGAQLFDSGKNTGTVELLRGTVSGGTYYAVIHSDNNDRAFDPKIDTAVLGSDNKPVMVTFKAN